MGDAPPFRRISLQVPRGARVQLCAVAQQEKSQGKMFLHGVAWYV